MINESENGVDNTEDEKTLWDFNWFAVYIRKQIVDWMNDDKERKPGDSDDDQRWAIPLYDIHHKKIGEARFAAMCLTYTAVQTMSWWVGQISDIDDMIARDKDPTNIDTGHSFFSWISRYL